MAKIMEVLAFVISVSALGRGAVKLIRRETPKYFQLYVCAAGCYMLEELWVIVNSVLGMGSQEGIITVRLFGFFGCLCFMLSANANEFDRFVDEGNDGKMRLAAALAPVVLTAIYAAYAFLPNDASTTAAKLLGFLSLSPALFASYYSLKHLLLPEDAMGYLRLTRSIDIAALVFYAANYAYPYIYHYCSRLATSVYDVFLAGMLFVVIVCCGKGADKWKTLI